MGTYFLQMHSVLRSKATVTGPDGRVAYTVKPAFSLIGRTLAILDADKQTVVKVRQCISLILPKFRIAPREQTPFFLRRRFTLYPSYQIIGRPWEMTGDYLKYYVNLADGNQIYEITADREVAADAYSITAVPGADALTGIGIALAIIATKQALRRSAK